MLFADFYAGAGGWTLGLSLAGHESVLSAEIWSAANRARAWNLGTEDKAIDVRAFDPSSAPRCSLVVGSPPCTQFSYANRGGNGDIEDGLADVRAFLRIVRAMDPEYWVMENVPRLTGILAEELAPGGRLEEFADLFASVDDFDMSEWGVPQRRRRCIAGRYPREALLALRGRRAPTLGQVLSATAEGRDPVWGSSGLPVTDNDPGLSLTWEESRINEEKKRNHPIYNDMAFPDAPGRTARTVTATCTKVSRESIVVPDGRGGHRLLSVRESAAVQSFPLSYQFAGASRSDRIKMAGNAIPPLFTYFVGLAVAGKEAPATLPSFTPVRGTATDAPLENAARRAHRPGRPFRAAIRGLRYKSGMSFELRNGKDGWEVVFNSGGPGRPKTAGPALIALAAARLPSAVLPEGFDATVTQAAWEESRDCSAHPFRVADRIGEAARHPVDSVRAAEALKVLYEGLGLDVPAKAGRNAGSIAAGIAVAAAFNKAAEAEKAEAA